MKNNQPKYILKYFTKYGDNSYNLTSRKLEGIKIAVVIPAIKELSNIRELLTSLVDNKGLVLSKTFFLFVVNNLASSNKEIKENNLQTIKMLNRIINKIPNDDFEMSIVKADLNLAYIDVSTEGNELDEKHGGVSLARKIGMDAALNYFDYTSAGKNILVCLDADCKVDENYLAKIYSDFSNNNLSAGYVNFEHPLPSNIEHRNAIINYEIFLRYYVLGLSYAESPFAFHTIGSTMICDTESYVKVGGMNKKKAAEDFYFMEKLAKNFPINKIEGATIFPSGRGSWRVPFGTGQRVNRFLEHRQNEYLLYSPESFVILKEWLKIYNSNVKFNPYQMIKEAKDISELLAEFLIANNFVADWQKILTNTKTELQLQKQKKMWFDGFKSLKLIHFLRDNGCPPVNMFEAADKLFEKLNIPPIKWEINYAEIPPLDVQIKYLERLREFA